MTENDVSLSFEIKDVNTKYQVCKISALIKIKSKGLGELMQKIIDHPNYNVKLYCPKFSHRPSFYDAIFRYGFNTLYYSHTFRTGKEFLKTIDTIKDNLPSYLKEEYKEKISYG